MENLITTENNNILAIFSGKYPNVIVDWNTLMEVRNKIEKLGYEFNICRGGIQIWKYNKHRTFDATDLIIDEDFLDDYLDDDLFNAVYDCSVTFINWYNKEKI